MNPTDLDFGNEIGRDLKAASARHRPPAGLYPRVTERQRQLERRRASYRAGVVSLAAVATIGGLAWAQSTHSPTPTTATQPDGTAAVLSPSPNPDRIDAYPIVNSVPGVRGEYGVGTTDQGWSGTLGVPQQDAAPTSIISIWAFPTGGVESPFPSTAGRIAGVREEALPTGMTRLVWNVGEQEMSVSGDNTDLMYQLLDIIKPTTTTATRDGYTFTGTLPGGLVELEAPYHLVPIANPFVDTNDGTFDATVLHGPLLNNLFSAGVTHLQPITINGRPGYRSTTGAPTIALAVSSDETLYVHSETFTMDHLLSIAKSITITDEATWKAHYNITGQPTGPTTTLAG